MPRVRAWIAAHQLLAVVLVVGFALRAANLQWGIPLSPDVGFYHGDEAKSWTSAVGFPEVYFQSRNFLYGTAVQYAVGMLLLPLKVVMVYLLGLETPYELVAIVLFRGVDVLLGTATILLTYHLGRLQDERRGLIAAVLFSVSFAPTINSALTTLDVPMAFFLVAGLLQMFRALASWRPASFAALGLIFGMLLGTKVSAVVYFAIASAWLAWFAVLSPDATDRRRADVSRRLSLVLLFACAAIAVFVVSTPHIFLHWSEYLAFMWNQKKQWYDKAPLSLPATIAAWWSTTSIAVGAPATVLAIAGAFVGGGSGRQRFVLILMVAATYLFWLGYLAPRFVIPAAPLLCLLAAAACERLLVASGPLGRVAGIGALAIALGWSSIFSLLGVAQKTVDPRTPAARFIAAEIPAGSSIGTATDHGDQWQHHGWRYPRIDFDRYRDVYFVDRPDYVVVTSLELDVMRPALQTPKLLAGLVWDPRSLADWYLSEPPPPEVFAFYQDLFSGASYELIATFSSVIDLPIDGACPAVFIYRRKS